MSGARWLILAGCLFSLLVGYVWLDLRTAADIRPGEAVFEPRELEIVVNRRTKEAWILHTPAFPVAAEDVAYAEFDHAARTFRFVTHGGEIYDLGVKVRSLVAPTLEQAKDVTVGQVYRGFPVRYFYVPIRHKNRRGG